MIDGVTLWAGHTRSAAEEKIFRDQILSTIESTLKVKYIKFSAMF